MTTRCPPWLRKPHMTIITSVFAGHPQSFVGYIPSYSLVFHDCPIIVPSVNIPVNIPIIPTYPHWWYEKTYIPIDIPKLSFSQNTRYLPQTCHFAPEGQLDEFPRFGLWRWTRPEPFRCKKKWALKMGGFPWKSSINGKASEMFGWKSYSIIQYIHIY